MSMHAHEDSRISHVEEHKAMNKNHTLGSLQGVVPPSTIRPKAFTCQSVSPLPCQRALRAYTPPSMPNPKSYIPHPRIKRGRTFTRQSVTP